jgi:hypothetical protein
MFHIEQYFYHDKGASSLKGKSSVHIVAFYFSLEELHRGAIREAFRIEGAFEIKTVEVYL